LHGRKCGGARSDAWREQCRVAGVLSTKKRVAARHPDALLGERNAAQGNPAISQPQDRFMLAGRRITHVILLEWP
jgi:hypothetical protein